MTIRTGSPCSAWDRFSPGGLDAGEAGRLPHRAHRTSTSGPHRPALFVRPCDPKLADSEPRPDSEPRHLPALLRPANGRPGARPDRTLGGTGEAAMMNELVGGRLIRAVRAFPNCPDNHDRMTGSSYRQGRRRPLAARAGHVLR